MRWFRQTLRSNRVFILTVLAVNIFYMTEGTRFVYAYQVYEQKEARLKEISEFLDIPVERLRPDHEGLFDSIRKLFVDEVDPVKAAGLRRLQEVLRKHEEQVASNPYLPQIEEVKREHAVYRIEGVIQDLMQLTQPRGGKALPEPSQRAILRNLHHALREDLTLPLPEGLPAKAQAKHAEMQAKLDRLFDSVRAVVAETQGEMKGTLAQKIAKLSALQEVETRRPSRPPRFADRPLPLRRVEKKVHSEEVSADGAKPARQVPAKVTPSAPPVEVVSKDGIAPELIELAESLGNSPARILAYVHDNIDFDPKWGAAKPPLGTLWEKSGTSWEQAWLLRDLLTAAGVDARFQWGEIEVPTELITNITGLDDPWRAGDLLTTAGMPIVLLTQGGEVIGARMSHVWVRGWVDFIPNRGATPGPGDYWIQMDPSLKRYAYTEGIPVHEQVQFSLGEYLQSGTVLAPRRAYEEALWAYIRANNLDCTTLEQLKKAPSVIREGFPILPGTLRGKILQIDGEAMAIPDAFQQKIHVEVRRAGSGALLAWESFLPALYGHRIEIVYQGATADDDATLDSYGGIFVTPPYLVDLMPMIKVAGIQQAAGATIGSAEEVEIHVTITPATGSAEVFVHDGYAGEPSVVATAFSQLPLQLIERFQQQLLTASAAEDEAAVDAATLQLLGARYLYDLGRDLADLAAWNWHRLLRLASEGMIVQTGDVTTMAGGAPLSFTRAEQFVDFPGFILGLFHAGGQTGFVTSTMELAGAQGSFLEGEVFNQVVERYGIAAVSALTIAQREGQVLRRVDSSNIESVLASVDLGADVEQQILSSVANDKIAWVAERPVQFNLWQGSGYILEDPSTGAAAYLLSGGYAGGADSGKGLQILERALLGAESWLGPLGDLFSWVFDILGISDDQDPSTQYGDPVNLANGNWWRTESDLFIAARGLSIDWSRTYNSQSTYSGPLGYGWTFTYGELLEAQADGSIRYRDKDGTEHLFTQDDLGQFQPPPGKHLVLIEDSQGFSLTTKDGRVTRFQQDGRMASISDRFSNTVSLNYDVAGNLESIVDAAGRQVLSVTTLDGKITELVDLSGRRLSYEYSGDDLTSVNDVENEFWYYGYDAFHNLISRTDPLAQSDFIQYDTHDRCYRHIDKLGYEETFAYSSLGERAVVTDRRGFSTFFEFDECGRAVLQIDPLGNTTSATWDGDNNRTSTTDPRGNVVAQTFDETGNVLEVTDPAGTTTFSYESEFNQIETILDPQGHLVTNTYRPDGSLEETIEEVEGEVLVQGYSFDSFGQLTELRDAEGNSTTLSYVDPDPSKNNGIFKSTTNALGETTRFETNRVGNVVKIIDPDENSLTVNFDNRGNITFFADWFGETMNIEYDDLGRPIKMATDQGVRELRYDVLDRVVAATDVLGNQWETKYDPSGNVIETIDPNGNRTTVTYDALGRQAGMVDPLGSVWIYGYCNEIGSTVGCRGGGCRGSGQDVYCEITDPEGNTSKQEFDNLGRVIRIIDPLENVTSFEYDELDRRTAINDPLMRRKEFGYDALGRLLTVTEANGARTEYHYDKSGNRVETIDAENRIWRRTFDKLNRLKSEIDPLGNTKTFYYDTLGNLDSVVDANGQTIDYVYNINQLETVRDSEGSILRSLTYDAQRRIRAVANGEVSLNYDYDPLNRLSRVVNNTLGKAIEYTFDAAGQLKTMAGPNGLVEYLYNARNELVEIQDPATGIYRFQYDSIGRRTRVRYPNGLETEYGYDAASRLEFKLTRNALGEVVDGYSYTFDAVGNCGTMTDLRRLEEHRYTYDEVYRLKRWERDPTRFEEYEYDLVGNREGRQSESEVASYSYDDANHLTGIAEQLASGGTRTVSFGWDQNGNLINKTVGSLATTYQFDMFNRLTDVSAGEGVSSFGYDPFGKRVRATENGSEKRFLLDYLGNGVFEKMVATYDDTNSPVEYYLHGPNVDEPLAQVTPEGIHYLHGDGIGSVTAASDGEGAMVGAYGYSPFGEDEERWGVGSRFAFTGRELDASGLMYYRARYYDTDQGRFLTRDTFDGFSTEPSSQHEYGYAMNNPVNRVDPSGNVSILVRALLAATFWAAGTKGLHEIFTFMRPELMALINYARDNTFVATMKSGIAAFYFGGVIGALLSYFYSYIILGWTVLRGSVYGFPLPSGIAELCNVAFGVAGVIGVFFGLIACAALVGAAFTITVRNEHVIGTILLCMFGIGGALGLRAGR